MTYQEYYNSLIRNLEQSEKNIVKQNKSLKGEKGYLDQQDLYIYMGLCNDKSSLLSKAEEILKLITDGKVDPQDEIDAVILTKATDNKIYKKI